MQPKPLVSGRSPRWREWVVPGSLFATAAAQIAGGAALLGVHAWSDSYEPFRATSGVVLILTGLIQARMALAGWRNRTAFNQLASRRRRLFWGLLSMGVVVCYGASLLRNTEASGAEAGGPYVFVAAVAAWYTAVASLLVLAPNRLQRFAAVLTSRPLRAVGWSLYGLVMCPLVAELGLRSYAFVEGEAAAVQLAGPPKLVPGASFGGRQVNPQGYWDEEFRRQAEPGMFRVAAIGGELTLSGNRETNLLGQIERAIPNLEVYNFGVPTSEPAGYASLVEHEVAQYEPDLVLAFISVGRDVVRPTAEQGWFDLASLHTYQLGSLWWTAGAALELAAPTETDKVQSPLDPQEQLRQLAGQLAICRTPMDDRMRSHWQSTFAALDRLVLVCRSRQIEVALVVSPAEFQVSPALLDTLRRRAGYAPEQVDAGLPQRRLQDFGQSRNVAVIDLLPSMEISRQPAFDRHQSSFTPHGHALAAETIGHWVAGQHRGWIAATAQARLP